MFRVPLFRFFPLLYLFLLATAPLALGFNGLCGQDTHELLRQSAAIFARWQGQPELTPSLGSGALVGAYPLAGALLRFLVGSPVWALQLASALAAATCLWLLVGVLELLSPGARNDSRWAYALLGLGLSPVFLRAGLASVGDAMALAFALAAFGAALKAAEKPRRPLAWLGALAFSVLAVGTAPWEGALGQGWAWSHFLQRRFDTPEGFLQYPFPNFAYLFYPLAHPAFCLFLPGLFFLAKRTDWVLPAKKWLLGFVLAYLLLVGGLPGQGLRSLLPAYVAVLWLLFPAWDRLYCYGFIFFPRITRAVLAATFLVQAAACGYGVGQLVRCHRLETSVASALRQTMPVGATAYALELDAALRTYLPDRHFEHLRGKRPAEGLPGGVFVLFNENLRTRWTGKGPVLHFDGLRANGRLHWAGNLGRGWQLWEVVGEE